MQLYVSLMLEGLGQAGVRRDLVCRLISGLALWDPEAARQLVRADLAMLLEPADLLKELLNGQEWLEVDEGDWEALWRVGAADQVEGRWERHSALYAFRDKDRELERRLWSAEVEVLLPWVETQRRALLERYRSLLHVPFITRDGSTIWDVRDLEIGHIQHLLYKASCLPSGRVMDFVRCLKEIRNALAHLEPLRPDLLTQGALEIDV